MPKVWQICHPTWKGDRLLSAQSQKANRSSYWMPYALRNSLYSSWNDRFLWCSSWLRMYFTVLLINVGLTENAPYPSCHEKCLYFECKDFIHLLLSALIALTKSANVIVLGSDAKMCTWSGMPPIPMGIPPIPLMIPPIYGKMRSRSLISILTLVLLTWKTKCTLILTNVLAIIFCQPFGLLICYSFLSGVSLRFTACLYSYQPFGLVVKYDLFLYLCKDTKKWAYFQIIWYFFVTEGVVTNHKELMGSDIFWWP